MIHVPRGLAPPALASAHFQKLRQETADYFSTGPRRKRGPRPFQHYTSSFEPVRAALEDLFHGKCAWCETPIGGSAPEVDNYRPRHDATGLRGEIYSDLYWWLAYEWPNLYLSCVDCNRSKWTRFPIEDEKDRAVNPGEERRERPLLLDPCSDFPERELIFGRDGRVVPAPDSERGRVTIEIFGLNRPSLVDQRLRVLLLLNALATGVQNKAGYDEILLQCGHAAPFAAVSRQFVGQLILSGQMPAPSPAPEWLEGFQRSEPGWLKSLDVRHNAIKNFQARQMRQEAYSVERPEHAEEYFLKTRLIEKVEIENFKAIERLELSLRPSGEALSDSWPWLVLLGENASGKSTVLEALALTLAGEAAANELGLDASDFVCRNGDAAGGSVRVALTGRTEPLVMTFRKGSPRFEHSDREPKVLLLGYGATRLLPRSARKAPFHRSRAVQIENLFDPFRPLEDPDRWLSDLRIVSDEEFELLREDLESILMLSPDDDLARENGRVLGVIGGVRVPLRQLSAGYQSVIALVADIMSVMHFRWKGHMRAAQGIVLLDEIGEHLHPTWKKKIVRSLRTVFPGVQFVATTHDPLCLRGVRDGEVVLMRRGERNRIVATRDLPPVEGMRVDQILTSEHFGLGSVYDDEAEKTFKEYYRLLALRQRSSAQERELARLRGEVDKLEVLGNTRRERLLLEEIDRYLAGEAEAPDEAGRLQLRSRMRQRIADLWKRLRKEDAAP